MVSSLSGVTNNLQLAVFTSGGQKTEAQALARAEPLNGQSRLETRQNREEKRFSALERLRSTLTGFNQQARNISLASKTGAAKDLKFAASSDSAVFTATADNGAKTDVVSVNVSQTAQSQILLSSKQLSAGAILGSGNITTVTFEFGKSVEGGAFDAKKAVAGTVTIDGRNNTLTGIAGAINEAGVGVIARVTNSGPGAALELETEQGGTANGLKISVSGDQTISDLLSFDPAGTQRLFEKQYSRDARFSIGDQSFSSASNEIKNAVAGVNLNLTGTGKAQLSIKPIQSSPPKLTFDVIDDFVSSFNGLVGLLAELKIETPKDEDVLTALSTELGDIINAVAPENAANTFRSLDQIGIHRQTDGRLEVNEPVLKAAVETNPYAVAALFTVNNRGIADQAVQFTDPFLRSGGNVDVEQARLNTDIDKTRRANENLTNFRNSRQRQLEGETLGIQTSAQTSLLDGSTIGGILSANAFLPLQGSGQPVATPLLYSQASLAFANGVRSGFSSLGVRTTV